MPFCQNCGKEYPEGMPMCGYCGMPTGEQSPEGITPYAQTQVVQPTPQTKAPKKKRTGLILFILILAVILIEPSNAGSGKDKTISGQKASQAGTGSSLSSNSLSSDETYENNQYYDLVNSATIKNIIGDTIVIDKITAKKNTTVEATIIAYASDGSVVNKSSDEITITAGEDNYFYFYFDSDVSDCTMKVSVQFKSNAFLSGDRNAVEMERYDRVDDKLYISVKQVKENIGSFSEFKILFYKGDKIIDADYGFFSSSATGLTEIGSTDVIEMWTDETDYDRIEFIYEP